MLTPPLYPFSAEREQQGPSGCRKKAQKCKVSAACSSTPNQPPGSPVPLSGSNTCEGGREEGKGLIISGGFRHAHVSTALGGVGSPVLQITQQTTKCRKCHVFCTLESLRPRCTWALLVVREVSSARGS